MKRIVSFHWYDKSVCVDLKYYLQKEKHIYAEKRRVYLNNFRITCCKINDKHNAFLNLALKAHK